MVLLMDKDFAAAVAPFIKQLEHFEKPPRHDVGARRKLLASFASPKEPVIPEGIMHELLHVLTADGFELPILRFKKKTAASGRGSGPAVLHIHGGGFISLSAAISTPNICHHVLATGVQFFSVDYRLAPEHPYPTPLEDCWTALKWVISNAESLGVSIARIGVMGESAGGGLAAGVTLLARDRALNPPLARQILGYPMLDDRTNTETEPGIVTLWDADDNITGWTAYLGSQIGRDHVPAYAAPARVEDVTGLPPLYMDVGQLDMFAVENLAYASKFLAARIETEIHLFPGLPHGFDGLAPEHLATKALKDNRDRQLRKLYE
ncbi:hypothetical protein VF21_07982 [Pseudogymnoascus sp. 05NY08]|nr:hypothetical protein V501_00066 [Pseudogymnoascus sp. VKM F-4519 (FW-2642)]OBT73767.1 hypothetical protein VF21_07982 [Pseudogymnoascus sp. 05NY08]